MATDEQSSGQSVCPLIKKIDDLEQRASTLDQEYNRLLQRASELEKWALGYVVTIDKERKLINLIDLLMKPDKRSTMLLDYLCLFFAIIIKNFRQRDIHLSSMKELWYALADKTSKNIFVEITQKFGFEEPDVEELRMQLDLIYERQDHMFVDSINNPTSGRPVFLPVRDEDMKLLIQYIRMNDDVASNTKRVLTRVVSIANSAIKAVGDVFQSKPMQETYEVASFVHENNKSVVRNHRSDSDLLNTQSASYATMEQLDPSTSDKIPAGTVSEVLEITRTVSASLDNEEIEPMFD